MGAVVGETISTLGTYPQQRRAQLNLDGFLFGQSASLSEATFANLFAGRCAFPVRRLLGLSFMSTFSVVEKGCKTVKKQIIFIIKFSLEYILEGHRAMNLAKGSKSKGVAYYREQLFSDRRLDLRFKIFENITLPSLGPALKEPGSFLLVLSSQSLPSNRRQRLDDALRPFGNATVRYCEPVSSVNAEARTAVSELLKGQPEHIVGEKICVATVRLDDDDGLARNFAQMLMPYVKEEFAGLWVSFPLGIRMAINASGWLATKSYMPKTSQGLARVELFDVNNVDTFGTAYDLGGHAQVDRRAPVIMDARQVAYIRTHHDDNDSGARPLESIRTWIQVSSEAEVDEEDLRRTFGCEFGAMGPRQRKSWGSRKMAPVCSLLYQKN
jgi:hypothetical protein